MVLDDVVQIGSRMKVAMLGFAYLAVTSAAPLPARFLNRLSDLLFILSRQANKGHADVLWKPGGERG